MFCCPFLGIGHALIVGSYHTLYCNYFYGYDAEVKEIMVYLCPPSPWSKRRMPELQCFCSGRVGYVKDS